MKVAVCLFARYREAAGRDRVEVEVREGATVEDVWRAVAAQHPVLERHRPHTLFAIGNDYVKPERPVQPGEELACFPPVSGGSAPGNASRLGASASPGTVTRSHQGAPGGPRVSGHD